MSKMVDTQVEKTQNLIDGIRKNMDFLRQFGYTEEKINLLECDMHKLEGFSAELDELLNKVAEKRIQVNTVLAEVKENYKDFKLPIKNNLPNYEWSKYGIADKK